jgi:hypothetical protein
MGAFRKQGREQKLVARAHLNHHLRVCRHQRTAKTSESHKGTSIVQKHAQMRTGLRRSVGRVAASARRSLSRHSMGSYGRGCEAWASRIRENTILLSRALVYVRVMRKLDSNI